jgi:hypothetical protein
MNYGLCILSLFTAFTLPLTFLLSCIFRVGDMELGNILQIKERSACWDKLYHSACGLDAEKLRESRGYAPQKNSKEIVMQSVFALRNFACKNFCNEVHPST